MPGTRVVMADGTTKAIEDVQPGDLVAATNPDPGAGTLQAEPVTAPITSEGVKNLVEITVDTDDAAGNATGTVVSTDQHLFWVDDRGRWLHASELQAGDWLRDEVGQRLLVISIRGWTQQHQRVHNLSVAGTHTYYVLAGNAALLVHNCGPGGTEESLLQQANSARDAEVARLSGGPASQRSEHSVVVGAYNVKTGDVASGVSSKALNECAEACAARNVGGDIADIRFTVALRPRGSGRPPTNQPVCAAYCEPTYGRNAFPDPATRFQSDEY
jgi:hypothetical protein